jgi:uncharacterized membrane protein YecN with MAPEG domain
MHTAPYFTAFGLLTIYHAARVILQRVRHKVSLGDGGVEELERMIRVFGNHSEYVPLGLVLLLGLEFVQAPIWYMHLAGGMLLIGRILHAMGLSQSRKASGPRFIGMNLTFISILLSSVGITLFSIWARV